MIVMNALKTPKEVKLVNAHVHRTGMDSTVQTGTETVISGVTGVGARNHVIVKTV